MKAAGETSGQPIDVLEAQRTILEGYGLTLAPEPGAARRQIADQALRGLSPYE